VDPERPFLPPDSRLSEIGDPQDLAGLHEGTTSEDTVDKDAFSIAEFCERHSISRSAFYNSLKDGTGPRTMKVGTRRLISREASAAWRRQCESPPTKADGAGQEGIEMRVAAA
jgi:predicted DNA-binding transcriptional regulator AlpA